MLKFFLTWIAVVSLLMGCGGHRHGSSITPVKTDGLIGSWSGTYQQSLGAGTGVGHRSGTLRLTITRSDATGHDAGVKVVGTVEDSERGAGTVTGYVTDYVQAPGSGLYFVFPEAVESNDIYFGRLGIDAQGNLVGTLALNLGDGSLPTSFDLAPILASAQTR